MLRVVTCRKMWFTQLIFSNENMCCYNTRYTSYYHTFNFCVVCDFETLYFALQLILNLAHREVSVLFFKMSWQMFFRPGNTVVDCIYKCNKQSLRAWDPTKKLKTSLLDLCSPRHTLRPVLWWLWSDGQWWRHGCSWGWPLRLAHRSARAKGVHASRAGEEDWRGVFRLKQNM